mmetsp:Transcript_15639/g.34195  ORF Transcript_15639/g.34195 Transcript_15639/m.34195 type:complete len:534 (-) Transcript_15639:662-2263(-)
MSLPDKPTMATNAVNDKSTSSEGNEADSTTAQMAVADSKCHKHGSYIGPTAATSPMLSEPSRTSQEFSSPTSTLHPLDRGLDCGLLPPRKRLIPINSWTSPNRKRAKKQSEIHIYDDDDDSWPLPRPDRLPTKSVKLIPERPKYPHTKVGRLYQATTLPRAGDYNPISDERAPGGDVIWDPNAARRCTTMDIDSFLQQTQDLKLKTLLMQSIHETGYSTAARAQQRFDELSQQRLEKQDSNLSLKMEEQDQAELVEDFSSLFSRRHHSHQQQQHLTNVPQLMKLHRDHSAAKSSILPNYRFHRLAHEYNLSLDSVMVQYYSTDQLRLEEERKESVLQRVKEDACRLDVNCNGKDKKQEGGTETKCDKAYCVMCNDGGDLFMCDKCNDSYHLNCHIPPLPAIPTGDWHCSKCGPPISKSPQQAAIASSEVVVVVGREGGSGYVEKDSDGDGHFWETVPTPATSTPMTPHVASSIGKKLTPSSHKTKKETSNSGSRAKPIALEFAFSPRVATCHMTFSPATSSNPAPLPPLPLQF